MIRAIAFDLDGTLIDSAPDMHAAANLMLAERGLAPRTLDEIMSFVGNGVAKLVERCLNAANCPRESDMRTTALASFEAHYSAAPAERTTVYEGVRDTLEILHSESIRMGVCTNKPVEIAQDVLETLDLKPFFASVVGGGTLPVLKPDPAMLHHCVSELGCDRLEALYVGDSETDESTAKAAGMRFALYSGGYRNTPVEAFDAALIFHRFDALLPLVRQQ